MESGNVLTAALVTAERSDHKTVTPFQLGTEWLTGGPKSRDFTSGDYTVELYKQHEHYQNALSSVTNKLKKIFLPNASNPDYGFPNELDGIEGVENTLKIIRLWLPVERQEFNVYLLGVSIACRIEVTANDIELE